MKIGAIICEYNPLHNGHLYQIHTAKIKYNLDSVIGIMSGSFVQRGEPAILDKYTRAKNAVENGVDLIIELPTYFSLQSAEFFSAGAIEILVKSGIVDALIFGSEIGSIEILKNIVNVINSSEYNAVLNDNLNMGLSYSLSSNNAIGHVSKEMGIEVPKINSNDILAIEYIKALQNSNLKPITIKRRGSDYLSLSTDDEFISATAIRNSIKTKNKLTDIIEFVPQSTYNSLRELNESAINNNSDEQLFNLLLFAAFVENREFNKILRFETGMDNLILNNLKSSAYLNELIDKSTSKRYTASRLRRFILNYILEIRSDMDFNHEDLYIRPLCFNEKGANILSLLKESSELPLIPKFSDFYRDNKNSFLDLELKASNLYNLLSGKNIINEDFIRSPIYLKSS